MDEQQGIALELFKGAFQIIENYPTLSTILVVIAGVLFVVKAIVKLTPTQKDDAILAKIMASPVGKVLNFIDSFASFKKAKK